MMGRLDVEPSAWCTNCSGTGKDPKKRTRKCPKCVNGKMMTCQSCYHVMPCPGTDTGIIDQSHCLLKKKSRYDLGD